jgi:hypothetical protein
MPKPTLADVWTVHDPMLSDNFDLVFTSLPGDPANTATMREVTIQCKSAVKPGTTMAEVEVELFGHKVMHGARRTWSNDMSITFVEDANGKITKMLENWIEQIRKRESQHGHFKKDYAVKATFNIYDQTGATTATYTLHNCWPSDVQELSFEGAGGQALDSQATFKYDNVERTL